MRLRLWALSLLLMFTAACTGLERSVQVMPVEPVEGLPEGRADFPWWNQSVFYEIFVRSFFDSDGDGIGDFNGMIEKLDYLNDGDPETSGDLGVHAIWLMPIFPSPSYHGYDVTDYYDVNPDYGTMQDFERLLQAAHEHGIRVIIDFPMNHTSVEHPWFQQSLDPNSNYRDWYIWRDQDPGGVGPWGQDPWHPGPNNDYYYGVFWEGMPDLNYENPDVQAEMLDVARFWLEDVGVDGFRLDGARYLVEQDGELADTQANHEFFKKFREFYKAINPQAVTVAEVWTSSFVVKTYLKGDQVDLAFDFDLASAYLSSAREEDAESALNQLTFSLRGVPSGQFAPFLTNHDIERVMSQLGGDVEAAKNAAAMLLTGPGVPFIYYGEEIGMQGRKPDERLRTPMQWSADASGGFTSGTPWEPLQPDYADVNLAAQTDVPKSLLSFYRSLIQARNQHLGLRIGETYLVESRSPAVYSVLRASEEESLLVVINLSDETLDDYNLTLEEGPLAGTYKALPVIGDGPLVDLEANAQGGFDAYQPMLSLGPNTRLVIQLWPNGE